MVGVPLFSQVDSKEQKADEKGTCVAPALKHRKMPKRAYFSLTAWACSFLVDNTRLKRYSLDISELKG